MFKIKIVIGCCADLFRYRIIELIDMSIEIFTDKQLVRMGDQYIFAVYYELGIRSVFFDMVLDYLLHLGH